MEKHARRRKEWHRAKELEKRAEFSKESEEFSNGGVQRRREISRRRWIRATCSVLVEVKCKQATGRFNATRQAQQRAYVRIRTRLMVLSRLNARYNSGEDVGKCLRLHKDKLEIERVQLMLARDAFERERLMKYIAEMGVDTGDVSSLVARLGYFGLSLKDNYLTMNYFKMARSLAQGCIGNREFYICFIDSPFMLKEEHDFYPMLFQKHMKVALADAQSYWKMCDKTSRKMHRRKGAVDKQHENEHFRWKRLVRLVILQDRADSDATVKNQAEARAHREVRAALVQKPERAFTSPGQSHKSDKVKWADEALDAGDKAKRVSTKAASLRSVQDAKEAKRKQQQLEIEKAIERARNLAIGDAIVEGP